MSRRGLLLVNLGTPDAPTPAAVRRYLREFLADPRVIDLNPVGRWLLLNLVILPFRPRRSAKLYSSIWTEHGSPLLLHGKALADALAARLGEGTVVELAMRYGQPSIDSALARLRAAGVDALTVVPLYPQGAASTTGSTLARIYEQLATQWDVEPIRVVPPFFDSPAYLDACSEAFAGPLQEAAADHVLFSFHGIPERHLLRSDAGAGVCLRRDDCCEKLSAHNHGCYRAQCFATARLLAQRLGLPSDRTSVGFQSRLGRTVWAQPYTDRVVVTLASRVRRLAVICPSFVSDCLETLEEIGDRARHAFKAAGGEELVLIPALNAHPAWVRGLATLCEPPRLGSGL